MRLMDWAGARWEGSLPWANQPTIDPVGVPASPTRLQVIAALIDMNGGPEVHGWGLMQVGVGLYGRTGLCQNEALDLLRLMAHVNGMLSATDGAEGEPFGHAVTEEWDRVRENKKSLHPQREPLSLHVN